MRKQVIENAAFEVATQIRTVEDCIEDALLEIADLQSKMIRARATAGVSTSTGHAALEQLASAVSALVTARGGMANCHGELRDAKQFVPGLRAVSFGEGEECPKIARTDLRIVA
ncbi:MAG TPA: hypothetical protein VGR05_09235 [Sphingomicrobium sp.]|nr:hypothetical protein [Sphingomicrobium sp.]